MRGISHLAGTGLPACIPPRTALLLLFLSHPFNPKTPSPRQAGFINFPAAKHFINDWWSPERTLSLTSVVISLWMFWSGRLIHCLLCFCWSVPARQLSKQRLNCFKSHIWNDYIHTKSWNMLLVEGGVQAHMGKVRSAHSNCAQFSVHSVITLQHCSGRYGSVYSSTQQAAVEEVSRQSRNDRKVTFVRRVQMLLFCVNTSHTFSV